MVRQGGLLMTVMLLVLDPLPTTLMLVGLVLLATILFANLRRNRGGGEKITPRERLERDKQLGGMRNDLRTMMVELEELTRRFSAQLDNKAARLEQLIEEADKRIDHLNGRASGDASTSRAASAAPRQEPTPPEPVADEPDDPLTRDVYRLADEGNDSIEIARQLDEHVGKVELILALRQG